jgi:hypothetical protein
MPKPVKLSDSLYAAARDAADVSHRTLSSQIEHWATLGRAIEGQITMQQTVELVRGVREARAPYATPLSADIAERIAATVQSIRDGSFSRAMRDQLRATGKPLYGTHPDFPGRLVRRNPDGTVTPGQLVNRKFIADAADEARTTSA